MYDIENTSSGDSHNISNSLVPKINESKILQNISQIDKLIAKIPK